MANGHYRDFGYLGSSEYLDRCAKAFKFIDSRKGNEIMDEPDFMGGFRCLWSDSMY